MAKGEQNGADTAALVARISELEHALEQKGLEHGELQDAHAALVTEHEQVKGELSAAAAAHAELSSKHSDLEIENAGLNDMVVLMESQVKELAAHPEALRADGGAPAGKRERGEELPPWKTPDYTGPLSADQAIWRNANINRK